MGWTVFEIMVNMFQGFIIQKFMENRMHVSKVHKIQDILCISIVTIYLSLPLFIKINIPDIMVFAVPLVYALLIADDKWYVSVFWTITLTVMFLTIVSLVLHIFTSIPGCSYDEIMKNTGIRIMFVLTTNGILTLALYFTSKIKKDYSAPYWSSLLLFLATNAALLLVEESLYALQINGGYEAVSSNVHFCMAYAGICASTLLVTLLYHKMSKSLENENRYKAEASAIRQSQRNQQEMEEMYKHLLAARHDLKQHMEIIEELASSGSNDEAKAYLKKYKEQTEMEKMFLTGSTGVDALLTAKYQTIKQNNIDFIFTPYPLNELPINEQDFCTIVGNLLDNAVEGCIRVIKSQAKPTESSQEESQQKNEKTTAINLTFSRTWDMFYIFCDNPCNESSISRAGDKWKSSKETEALPGIHGIGIASIEHIVRNVDGRCQFNVNKGMFSAKVVLPIKRVNKEYSGEAYDTQNS